MGWLWWVQGAHVGAAVVFAGGQVLWWAVVWPALLARPAAEARAALGALGPRVGAAMGGAALLSVVTGAVRAVAVGPVRSWADLGTPYGIGVSIALGLTLAAMLHGRAVGPSLATSVFRGGGEDGWAPDARRRVYAAAARSLGLVGAIGAVMVRLRFGG